MPVMTIILTFNQQEIINNLHYQTICEVLHGHTMGTSKRRQLEQLFTKEEMEVVERISKVVYKWYIKTGVPDVYSMTFNNYEIWMKLLDFCTR